jgi:uncharacterized membrane protein
VDPGKCGWLIISFLHIFFVTDTSFYSISRAGFNPLEVILIVLLLNSLFLILCYALNQRVLEWIGKKIKRKRKGRIVVRGVKIYWVFSKSAKKFEEVMIHKFGYRGLAVLGLIPYIPGLREGGLIIGQAVGLKYTLVVILVTSAIKTVVLGIIWSFCF